MAFTAFEPFPSRQALTRRHEAHIQKAEATYKEEEKLRAALQLEAQKKEFKDKKVGVMCGRCSCILELFFVASY